VSAGQAARVISHMDSYLELTCCIGVRADRVACVHALDVGECTTIEIVMEGQVCV